MRLIGRAVAAPFKMLLTAFGALESYRVRVIVEVDTPEGVHSGSGVFEIRAARNFALLPDEVRSSSTLRGEAVPIDLPGGRTLFALLRRAGGAFEMHGPITAALDPDYRGGSESFMASLKRLSARAMVGRSAVLPPEFWPLLVTFRDPAVPASVGQPEAGTQIRAIRLVVTDEPVTIGIARRLPWVDGLRGYLGGPKILRDPSLANNLTATHFRKTL